ncbi:hypothetical protein L3Q82_019125 [Scortum barcoo]|uniref:Uncharacterized protein n=1 Tax=Scortum barcoo TaxID=214431 RepID=A0ACB8VGD3_9TELE|nr:hypothetical protein L3Q82_019125 [Scortum barcoo]
MYRGTGVHISTSTCLPEMGGLIWELPDIIMKAAAATNLLVFCLLGAAGRKFSWLPPGPASGTNSHAFFGVKSVNVKGGRRPILPSTWGQLMARLADRSHQCAFQASAAANNIAMLAYYMRDMALQPDSLPPEQAAGISRASSAILTVCIRRHMLDAVCGVADNGTLQPMAEQLQHFRGAQERASGGSHHRPPGFRQRQRRYFCNRVITD